ncbi:MAG: isopentenyl phosphate kinase [Acidimicrobiales bacterium]
MKKLFILKIGGSVITNKESIEHTVREGILREIFTKIAAVQKGHGMQLIIVHGAGGHVHHLAHQYGLRGGTQGNLEKEAGALHTQKAVEKLHEEIIEIGNTCGLPLQSVPTHDVLSQTDRKIRVCDIQRIQKALDENNIPVMYGDMVSDTTLGMSICSGDAVTAHLCTLLPVQRIFFATDVNGVYTNDPHTHKNAQLVEEFTFSEIDKSVTLTESHNTDTTGGLQGKIEECTELFNTASHLEEIHIFNGLHSANYHHMLLDEKFPHSCIIKK